LGQPNSCLVKESKNRSFDLSGLPLDQSYIHRDRDSLTALKDGKHGVLRNTVVNLTPYLHKIRSILRTFTNNQGPE
jgi:hypothetical protein